ncbi:MAG: hypothetical protein JNJ58_11545 [Chitinophagaceae bacterium]|nr:hypothetical protein [Chitinophagaceae bacterium]
MAKKNKQQFQTAAPAPAPKPKPAPAASKTNDTAPRRPMLHWLLAASLLLITVLIYSNTFKHRFVLDDHGIIKNNKITKAAFSLDNTKTIFTTPLRKGDFSDLENSLYRPFTKLLFNIEWNVFGGDPHKFHIINVLLYALTGVLLFFILFDAMKKKWVVPFLVSLLFLVHPIHTEVVANVKSGDEVLSLLGILIALRGIQLYLSGDKKLYFGLAIAGILMGLFSKESTVVAMGLFPLFIYYFTDASVKKNIIISSVMGACTIFFLICRQAVLHGYKQSPLSALDNYMVLCTDGASRFASAVNTLGLYIKTFFVPHPLSCDYSYSSLMPVTMADAGFILSFLLFAGMFVYAILKFKQKEPIGFGFLWFFVTISITSNVFFLIGTSFGERLFFVPSLGLCLSVVLLLARFFHKKEEENNFMSALGKSPVLFGILFLVAALYSYKTYSRNEDWSSDFNLFSKDVQNYPNSTHLLFYIGNHLSGNERKEILTDQLTALNFTPQQIADSLKKESYRSIAYLTKSLSIYPALPSDGYNQLGKAYFNITDAQHTNFLDSAQKYYMKAYSEDSTNPIFMNNLGTVQYNSGRVMEAFPYFVKAFARDTTEPDFANNIGCIYGATQRPDSAIYWFKVASRLDPADITSLQFLDITYRAKGDIKMADYYKSLVPQAKALRAQARQ